jgi:outer membrane protein OmpA-like peptidoglycan-associated protein
MIRFGRIGVPGNGDIVSGYRNDCAIAVLVAALTALAGCATPVDENLKHARERLTAASANHELRAEASGLLADAARTLALASKAGEPDVRHHYTYMVEKNLDIAAAIVARKQAERELAALRRRPPVVRVAPISSPKPVVTGPNDAAATLAREMERERLELAIREARDAQARAKEIERSMEQLESRKPPDPGAPAVSDVQFAANTTTLSPGAKRRLDPLIVQLRDDDSIHVVVEGYTDNTGTHESNLQVSLVRARAVKAYLVENGIPADRVQALGLGDQYPIASNRTEEGRRQNRRVEIVVDRTGGRPGPAADRP